MVHLAKRSERRERRGVLSYLLLLTSQSFSLSCSLSGFGGGGQVDTSASNLSSVALNAVFAGVGFMSGTAVVSRQESWE